MTVKTLINELLDMPMDARVDCIFRNVDDFVGKVVWVTPIDYEDGTIGMLVHFEGEEGEEDED